MNNERILAARKKLREYQLSKHQNISNKSESDLSSESHDQTQSYANSSDSHQEIYQNSPTNAETLKNGDIAQNIEPAQPLTNLEQVTFSADQIIQENISVQDVEDPKTLNHNTGSVLSNQYVPTHSRNSSANSQLVQDNSSFSSVNQTLSLQQIETPKMALSAPDNMHSLQKEHLLQMADAVASVLDHEQSFDESEVNICVLKQKNQFLMECLEEQKQVVHQLHVQLSQSNSRKAELEAIVATKESEYENKLIRELGPLKEKIKLDAQTIGILVAEKAELTATNSQSQITIHQKTDDIKELFGNFKSSQQRVSELEAELSSVNNNVNELTKMYEKIQKDHKELEEKYAAIKKENEMYEMDVSELKQKLNYKSTELTNLHQELEEKIALLQLSEIQLQQLSNLPRELGSLETQHHTTKVLEQQLSQMKQALENVNGEKDEVSKKYQNYIQQLDERHIKVLTELETAKQVIVESEIREQSYIQRLSELDAHLQIERQKQMPPQPQIEDQSEKIDLLTKNLDNLVLEQELLHSVLNDKQNEIEALKNELKELHDIKEHSVDASKLATALQSEQLGASRAVLQNQQLKTQLDEMHDAFITLSNTKLDLTEQLQAERTIGKKLNAQLNEIEKKRDELKEQLASKEEALNQFEKEKLQAAQIEDQILHYQAQSHSAMTLQQELQKALIAVETLKKENQILLSKINTNENDSTFDEKVAQEDSIIAVDDKSQVTGTGDNVDAESKKLISSAYSEPEQTIHVKSENSSNITLFESFKKLEKRFKESMEKVADLTDEKQRLEHLVTQLQGETETIGEYVTLYQKQRSILNQKAKEKENTFHLLLEQRNQQQDQLRKLKILVADLIRSKTVLTATTAEEDTQLSEPSDIYKENQNIEVIEGLVNKIDDDTNEADKTTSKILDLLTEIKDCDSCMLEPNFQPCPCCSGKLITV